MWTIIAHIVVVLLLILCNGFFAMAELAVLSARRGRLAALAKDDPGAAAALELHETPGKFLSTAQIGITLVSVLAGAFSGATLADHLADWLVEFPTVEPYAKALALGIVVLAISFATLILGELAPKRLAFAYAETIASAVARPFATVARAAGPVVNLLDATTSGLLGLFGLKRDAAQPPTDEEITHLVAEGAEAGHFEAAEHDMVKRVFRLGDREVGSIMTPRTEIVWLDLADGEEVNQKKIGATPYSRFPVIDGDQKNVLGIARSKDLAGRAFAGKPFDLRTGLRPVFFVPETTKALGLLELFKQHRVHLAMVVDEYGDIQGLVTLNDIIESVVGDVPMAGGLLEEKAVRRADGSWLMDGLIPIDELKDTLDISDMPGEGEGTYRTLAGFVLSRLGRVPKPADAFEWDGMRFEVLDMDGRRIDKVLVVPSTTGSVAATKAAS